MSGTMFLSDEQTGKYIKLLCAQHLTGHLSEKDMLKICKTYDEDIWKKFKKDDTGKFFNERLELEIFKRKEYSKSRSDNRKGHKETDTKKVIPKKDMSKTSNSYVKHMEDENEDENGIVDEKGIEERKANFITGISLFRTQYTDKMLNEFCGYWTEHSQGAKKMRFELQKFFDLNRRLKTWQANESKFKNNGKSTTTEDRGREQAAIVDYFNAKYGFDTAKRNQ